MVKWSGLVVRVKAIAYLAPAFWAFAFLMPVWSNPLAAQDFVSPEAATGRYLQPGGTAKSFMVVAANPLAAEAGAEILKAGGSAIDAAITVQLVLNIVEPQSSGIGGGTFIVHWDHADQKIATYDGREVAPSAADSRRFIAADGSAMGRTDAVIGGRSVGVPGVLRALELAHREHGKLPWADLFAPAIALAENGFPLSPRLHDLLDFDRSLNEIEPAASFFYQPDGSPKPVGTIIKNPMFAATLREIASGGAGVFHSGRIAQDIVAAVTGARVKPGDMTLADLAAYRAVERPPICASYRDRKVCGMGPPTSGGIGVLQTLKLLEQFDLAALGPASAKAYHALIEAGRLVFADRAVYIADPDVLPVPTAALLSPEYLERRGHMIDLNARMKNAPPGKLPVTTGSNWRTAESPERPSTSHFSIVDAEGNAVAMTTSIEASFGSHLMVRGFMLNNTLTDFSYSDIAKGNVVANAVGPNKRPRSSMAPTLVFDRDGKLEIVVGSPGGPAIVGFVVDTLVAMIDWNMTPQDAISAPHVIGFGRGVMIEPDLASIKDELEALGHQARIGEFPSGIHAIRITKDKLLGGADPRREGAVAGE
ncbi:MAG: gamma-glutamyltransferase [Rhodobacteraceae bacterium]|nr:gamma-glutamyltransferase [Paracoccaceae bacterium]